MNKKKFPFSFHFDTSFKNLRKLKKKIKPKLSMRTNL